MNKANISYLHQFIFAVSVVVLVYSGVQVLGLQELDNKVASWLYRSSGIAATVSILFLAFSFAPTNNNNRYSNEADRHEKAIKSLYFYEGKELEYLKKDTVKAIELGSKEFGIYSTEQNKYHVMNMRLVYLSIILMTLSAILYCVGGCFI